MLHFTRKIIQVQAGKEAPELIVKITANKKQLKEVVVTAQKNNLVEYQLDKMVVNANALVSASGGNAIA